MGRMGITAATTTTKHHGPQTSFGKLIKIITKLLLFGSGTGTVLYNCAAGPEKIVRLKLCARCCHTVSRWLHFFPVLTSILCVHSIALILGSYQICLRTEFSYWLRASAHSSCILFTFDFCPELSVWAQIEQTHTLTNSPAGEVLLGCGILGPKTKFHPRPWRGAESVVCAFGYNWSMVHVNRLCWPFQLY